MSNTPPDAPAGATSFVISDGLTDSSGKVSLKITEIVGGGAEKDDAEYITFTGDPGGDPLTEVNLSYIGKNAGDPDTFRFDLSTFDDDFLLTLKSESSEDTVILEGVDSFETNPDGSTTINYFGADGKLHVMTIASTVAKLDIYLAPDGIVDGTSGDDVMDIGYVDARGDIIDGADGDDDTIIGYVGSDSINGGAGDDMIFGDERVSAGIAPTDRSYPGGTDGDTAPTAPASNLDYTLLSGGSVQLSVQDIPGTAGSKSSPEYVTFTDDPANAPLQELVIKNIRSNSTGDEDVLRFDLSTFDDDFTIRLGTEGVEDTLIFENVTNETFNGNGLYTIEYLGSDDQLHTITLDAGKAQVETYGPASVPATYDDTIDGGAGNDYIDAGFGNDSVDGGIGDDMLIGNVGNDIIDGGVGNDVIYGDFESGTSSIDPNVGAPGDESAHTGNIRDITLAADDGDGSAADGDAGSTIKVQNDSGIVKQIDLNDQNKGGMGEDVRITDNGTGDFGTSPIDFKFPGGGSGDSTSDTARFDLSTFDDDFSIIVKSEDLASADGDNDPFDVDGPIQDVIVLEDVNSITDNGDGTVTAEYTGRDGQTYTMNIAYGGARIEAYGPGGFPIGGNDTLDGGEGDDTIYGGFGNDSVDGGAGNDTIDGGAGSDTLTGGLGNDSLDGGDGDDDFILGAGDTASGGGGDDEFILDPANTDGPGTITIDGGADGTNGSPADGANGDTGDSLDFTGLDNVTIVTPLVDDGTGSFTGVVSYTNDDGEVITVSFTEIEKVTGLPDGIVDGLPVGEIMDVGYTDLQSDKITDGADSIRGNAGDDSITAGGGNDTVDAGADNDTVNAGLGDDSVLGGLGDDSLLGDAGNDTLLGNEGNDTIDGGIGNDSIDGGVGNDSLTGGAGNDTILGGDGSDTIAGGPGADSINGGAGDDDIAVGGADTVAGGSGDDVFTIDPTDLPADVAATIDGGTDGTDGNPDGPENGDAGDILDLGNQTADLTVTLSPNPETGTVNGLDADGTPDISFTEIEKVITGAGDDTVAGGTSTTPIDVETGAGDDSIVGGLGNDTIDAGTDNDTVDAGAGDDSVTAGDGNDSVDGGAGNDTIDGGAGSDTLTGGLGDDSLDGGDGDDDFILGAGDTASGGGGDDEFILDPANTDGPGTITIDGGADGTNGSPADGANGDTGDSLDFTGLDNVTIVTPLVDDGTGSFTGVVSYTNDDGEVITVSFTEIEKVTGLPDGIVDGLPVGEIMDVGYTDLQSDKITDGADSIRGNAGDDSITAGGGNDTVDAGADDDTVNAGLGDDSVLGGLGDDSLLGDAGNDTLLGNEGNDTIDGGTGNDSIDGGVGNDSMAGGTGNDTILGGDGSDTIAGGLGADSVLGGLGDDSILGNAGDDTLSGDDGNDTIRGGIGNDTIDGGVGNDSLIGGDGNDSILGADGNDTVSGGDGNDTVDGGIGDDVIDTSGLVNVGAGIGVPDAGYPGVFPADVDPNNDKDSVSGGAGNDSIITGDDDDTIDGGAGNDTINAGIDDDSVTGGTGDDLIVGGEGNDTIDAGDGNDTVYGGNDPALGLDVFDLEDDGTNPLGPDLDPNNGRDLIFGGAGNDVLYGQDDDDTISGGDGEDFIDGGIDDDLLFGNASNDTILGGQGNDTIDGGDGNDEIEGGIGIDIIDGGLGNDTIRGGAGNDIINGGDGNDEIRGGDGADTLSGGDGGDLFIDVSDGDIIDGGSGDPATDFDVLNLTGLLQPGGSYVIENAVPDTDPLDAIDDGSPNDGQDGTVVFRDAGGVETARINFTNIESIVPCFTPGTLIATAKGQIRVEDLKPGDRVITRDNGLQEIAWVGQKHLTQKDFVTNPELKPVLIKAGSLGENMPERDIMVSPNHRMLIADKGASMYFDEPEVLVAAKHFVGKDGISHVDVSQTSYIHFMFERHEVVLSDGTWTESFYPGDYTIDGLGAEQRAEIFALFPELETETGQSGYRSARAILKKYEAKLLMG